MAVTLTEYNTVRRLVAAGNSEFWFEDLNVAAGTMVELAAANGDIDTTDNLNMFEAYHKTFVVNGTKLKVADFVNTKLTLAVFTTAPTRGSTITQSNGTTATMVVDFVNTGLTAIYGYVTSGTFNTTDAISGGGLASSNSLVPAGINGMLTHSALATAHASGAVLTQATTNATMTVEYTDGTKTHTYGRITAGTFNTTNAVTGSGSGTGFTPIATDTSPPVWYDYTVYPGGASGSLPDQAYLGCLYRGRIVLSGNSDDPEQWYMSRQANPYDLLYAANDDQSPVAGGNALAGKTGDVIRCLIPYQDDYLIFGCANSIWVLRGDPAANGSLDIADPTVGIYGANSWCFDGAGNLYFWGTGGIYTMPKGFGSITNLTEMTLPELVKDEAADPSTHRITMEYDRKNYGLVICVTKLSDGSNSNYFFSLNKITFGAFPESYPDECGAYSMFYYDANDKSLRDLLIGSRDGYLLKFDPTAKDDDKGSSTAAIDAYVLYPIIKLSEEEDKEGKLISLTVELAGGASGGSHTDMDGVTYSLYSADDAETLVEAVKDGDTPKQTGTLSGTGRKTRIRSRVRGAYLGLKFSNSTASETFVINKATGTVVPAGRIR